MDVGDDEFVEQPPRNTSKAKLPDGCVLKRTNFNRSKLFVDSVEDYQELRCSTSITQHVQRTSRFHSLVALNNRTADDFLSTTVSCWHDGAAFDGPVVPIPKHYDSKERCFVVFGCFCSFSCARAHILEGFGFDVQNQLVLLERMGKEVYGLDHLPQAAPPRHALEQYGGPYSLTRFRELHKTCESALVAPPFVSTYMVMEERENGAKVSSLGLNGIGTVRGLRRPAEPIRMISTEVPKHSPYLEFLKSKGVDPAPAPAEAPPKETRASTRKGERAGGTLSKFMLA